MPLIISQKILTNPDLTVVALPHAMSFTPPSPARKGILLAGGHGSRLFPLTRATSKQLMPIYDKPMVYYPLCTLMQAGIRDVLVISSPRDLVGFCRLLGDGSQWGIRLEYTEQARPAGLAQALLLAEPFLDGSPCCLALGDNLFHGSGLRQAFHAASARQTGATIFAHPTSRPSEFGVVEFSNDGRVLSLEEKPTQPKSHYAVPGIYFYDHRAPLLAGMLRPSPRGELEITDLNRAYLERGELFVEPLGRGTAWLDTGTPESMAEASEFVRVLQRRQGMKIACPEETAYRQGWIDADTLHDAANLSLNSDYGSYLMQLWMEQPSPTPAAKTTSGTACAPNPASTSTPATTPIATQSCA